MKRGTPADLEATRQSVLQPFHPRHQIGFWGLDHEVIMIAQQHPGMHSPTRHPACFPQRLHESPPVFVIPKNWLAPIAPSHHL
jgi:hypothetical protein